MTKAQQTGLAMLLVVFALYVAHTILSPGSQALAATVIVGAAVVSVRARR